MEHGDDARTTELERIAEEGYLFGFPIVLMDVTRRVTTGLPAGHRPGFGPMNWFNHRRTFPPGDFREVVRPNFDTLYSTVWFDVRAEPLVVSVPDTGGRYYMLPMMDMWTDVFAVVGSRATGTRSGHHAIVPPGWQGELPDGVERIDAPTPMGWIIGRTRTDGAADYANVQAIQDGFVATPLSVWPSAPREPVPRLDESVDRSIAPLDAVLAMSGVDLLSRLAALMVEHRPHPTDHPVVARMRRLGVVVGETFDPSGADPDVVKCIEAGAASARQRMRDVAPHVFPRVDGWSQPTAGIGVYGTDYLRRAVIAMVGLGANRPEDAVYPVLHADADGGPVLGDVDHVLRFEADSLPPADAFWSVTMYDGEGFTVPNELDRYALGDRDPLVVGDDGSVELYLQHRDPGPEERPNWLPTPRGSIGVTMRLYGPRPEVLDGRWTPPPLRRR